MTLHNYWWLLIWPLLFGGFCLAFVPKQEEMVLGRRVVRWNWLPAAILAIPFIIWAGWRTDKFGDTGQYRITFNSMPIGLSQMWPYVRSRSKGYAFVVFEYLFKTIISSSDILFFLAVALIQLFLLVKVFRKYSRNYWLSFFLFIASTDYMSWMHNGIRQFLAVTIIVAALPLLIERRYFLMCLVVLGCALIHSSAIVFLPFVFLVNGRAWNVRTFLFIVALIVSIIFIDRVSGFIVKSMEDTAYEGDISIFLEDDGTNFLRVLFYSVPTIVSWLFRERIYAADDPLINVCTNLSIVATGVYVFSYFTSGILVGALPIYFSLANYILIPWLIDELFNRESAILVQGGFVAVYSYFFYYQMGTTWRLL